MLASESELFNPSDSVTKVPAAISDVVIASKLSV